MNKLFAIIGLPRSSKSTLAKKWLNYNNYIKDYKFQEYQCHEKDKQGFFLEPFLRKEHIERERRVVISGDDIRQALYGSDWNTLCEDYVDSIKWTMIRTLLHSGHTVLLDETNTSKRSLRKILEIDIEAEFAFVNTTPEECHRRADEGIGPYCKSLLHKPINRMAENLKSLAFEYAWAYDWHTPEWLDSNDVELIIREVRANLINYKREFTNEPINENPELSKLPITPKDSKPPEPYSWTGDMPLTPSFQVW